MSATVAPSRAATSTSRSRPVSGDTPAGERRRGQRRIDHPLAARYPADRVGQLLGGRVLDDEAERAGLHRPPQVAGPAERGQDDHPAARDLVAERGRGGQAVEARHLDVEQRDVGMLVPRGRHHLVAAPDLRHDLEVVLEFEQRGERRADQRLVVGEQHPDRHAGIVGSSTACSRSGTIGSAISTRNRQPSARPEATSVPPAASTRSRSPVRPLPAPAIPPRPLSSMVIQRRAERDRAAAGPGVPHDVGHAFPDRPNRTARAALGSTTSTAPGSSACTPAARSTSRALASSPTSVTSRYPDTAARTSAERAAAQLLHLGDLPDGALRIELGQSFGETSLDGDRRERMAEQIVQVSSDSGALVFRGEPGHLSPRRGELHVRSDDREETRTSRRRRARR